MNETFLSNMGMQFYIVVKGYGHEETAGLKNIDFMKRYIEIKSG